MHSHKTLAWLCTAAALMAAPGRAQQISLDGEQNADGEHPRGVYTGVKPGGDEAPTALAKPGSSPAAITWPGFQMQPDGSSRVFVQLTTRVEPNTVVHGNKIMLDFGNVIIAGETNRFPLYTNFFNTPVTRVEMKRANKRTVMELTLRAQARPNVSTEQAKSGYHFVYVDFPAGSFLTKEPQPIGPPPAADKPNPPAPTSAALKEAPAHLEGSAEASGQVRAGANAQASGSASVNAGADAEVPPGMGKAKAKAKASGKAKTSGKIGF